MNIAYISKSIIPSRTANSVHVMKMSQAFSNNGCKLKLYCIGVGEKGDVYKYYGVKESFCIERFEMPKFKPFRFSFAFKVFKKVKNDKVDIIYGRHLLSLYLLSFLKKPIAYEAHTLSGNYFQRKIFNLLLRKDNFRFLVTISESLKSDFLKTYKKLDQQKIIVLHDGADLNKKDIVMSRDVATKHNVGYVGHLYSGRGIEIILKTARALPNVKFHIIGGEDKDINFWKETNNLSNVVFYGHIPNGELESYYAKFNIVLAPYQNRVAISGGKGDTSRWMSPLKIFEYMSYKKAIVVSEIDVLKEILEDEKDCLFCDSKNYLEWVNAILRLISDKKLLDKIRNNAFGKFKENYTWDKRAENIVRAFQDFKELRGCGGKN